MNALRSITLRAGAMLLLAVALSACGFQLRGTNGQYHMPFQSIYLGFADTSPLGTELKRNLRGGDAVVVVDRCGQGRGAVRRAVAKRAARPILSLNSQGRVREYLLTYTLVFRVRDAKDAELLGATEISLKRSIAFNESQVLAKESEEALLYRDMQTDLVQQILRRLAAIKRV